MPEQMAIIREVGIGCRDVGTPVLWFTVCLSESSRSLQILSWDEAYKVLKAVEEVRQLEGKPCWVDAADGIVRFLRLWEKL